MNLIPPIFFTMTAAVLLILLGYWLHGRLDQAASPLAAPTAVGVPGTQSTWLTREEAVDNLKALRRDLEADGQYGRIEAFLLFDVASFLGLDDYEIQTIIGACWFGYIGNPADLDLEEG